MLHSIKPADFVAPVYLARQWQCCNCNNPFVFGDGVVFTAHYVEKTTHETNFGLMCFCSTTCILDFENKSYMGNA